MVIGMTRKTLEKVLAADDLTQLERWVKAHGTPQQVVLRSRIGLAVASGQSDVGIASTLGVNRHTVRLWRQRLV